MYLNFAIFQEKHKHHFFILMFSSQQFWTLVPVILSLVTMNTVNITSALQNTDDWNISHELKKKSFFKVRNGSIHPDECH